MTKREAFEMAVQVMTNTTEGNYVEAIEVINKEIERLSAPRSNKPTKTQKENIQNMETVLNALVTLGHPARVMDIVKMDVKDVSGESMTSSKVTAMLSKLCNENKAVRNVDKKATYYSVA